MTTKDDTVPTESDNAKDDWRDVRILAARVAVACSERTGRPVDPRVKKLAESSPRTR